MAYRGVGVVAGKAWGPPTECQGSKECFPGSVSQIAGRSLSGKKSEKLKGGGQLGKSRGRGKFLETGERAACLENCNLVHIECRF